MTQVIAAARALKEIPSDSAAVRNNYSTISEVIKEDGIFVDGDWVESKDQDPRGDVRLIQLADVGDGVYRDKSNRYLTSTKARELGCTFLQPGDLLIARMPDPLGRACIFPGDDKPSVTVVDVCIVRTGRGGANHRWLMHRINSAEIRSAIAGLQSGSTRKRISRSNLARIRFSVPPVDEQQRVVAEIEKQFTRLDAGVVSLKRVKAALNRYRASVLKAACEGRLVPTEAELARKENRSYETGEQLLQRVLKERRDSWNCKGKYKERAKLDSTKLAALAEGWTWVTLDSLLREPLRNGHSAKASATRVGLRVFTLSAVTENDFSEKNTKLTVASPDKVADLWAQPGDIYVERSNTPELVGISRLYTGPPNFAFIPDLLIRVRVQPLVSDRYVALALLSERGRAFLRSRAQGISGTMPKIDQQTVALTPIALAPFPEQQRIVAEIEHQMSVIEELEAVVATNLQRAARVQQAVLHNAFAGEL